MGTVDTAFVRQFEATIAHLVQQKQSKLRMSVKVDTDFVGEFKFYDQLGKSDMVEKVTRHQDTPIIDPDHQRRRITKRDFIHNTLFDKEDQLAMIVDPKSSYAENASFAAGRTMDDRIIEAYDGTAKAGKEGGTDVPFDSNFQVAAGGVGMTKNKLISAMQLLDDEDVEEDNRFLALTPEQVGDLLKTTEATSSDFNTVKALVDGSLKTWIGFNFIKISSQRLQVNGAGARLTYAYHKAAIQLAIQKEASARIDERPDKNYAWQVFLNMSIGATRLEEKRIVEIACVVV